MRAVNSLEEIDMPTNHKIYLEYLLEYFRTYPKIEKILLLGSCAKGSATPKSDIDLFLLGSEITDIEDLLIDSKRVNPICYFRNGLHVGDNY